MSDGSGAARSGAGTRPPRLPRFLAGTLLVALALPASAQTADYTKALGKDDEAFARALSRTGYADLAESVLAALEKSGGASAGGLRSSMVRLDLELDRARREPDVNKRITAYEDLIAARETFANKNSGSAEATEILDGQLELYRTVGELIVQALQQPDTPEPDALRKRGEEILLKAVEALEKRLADADAAAAAPDLNDEQKQDIFFTRMLASYGLARTQYFRALLQAEEFGRTVLAKKALDILLDFQLEYSDQLLCYEGYIYEGLANDCIGQSEKALESYDEAIKLRETYEQARNGVYQMEPAAADIVSSAVQQKMLLQAKLGDHAGAAETARDFLATTNEPWTTMKGIAVMAEQAKAFQQLGDQKSLDALAKTMVEVDPFGEGGRLGRELLGGGGGASTLGAAEVLRLARQEFSKEPARAIELCQRVMILARGTKEEDDLGADAGLLLGILYLQRNAWHEAVVAWEGAARRYPDGKAAPDCLWRAINGYLTLQGQERRELYKTLAQELLSELSTRYPKSEFASKSGLIEGQQLEAEQDFARAAMVYERIAPGSAGQGHEEGQYRAGAAWLAHARKLLAEGKEQDGKDAAKRAETLLVNARAVCTAAAANTLETSVQDKMRAFALSARLALADVYLLPAVGRAADVAPLLQGLENELAKQPERMGPVWDKRFRALRAQNKLDEAIALFDAQMRLDADAAWLETGAAALAPILDQRGQELAKADPKSSEVDRLWGRAATYYQLAIRAQLDGDAAIQVDQLEGVADRLFVFGLRLEGVPDTVESFAEWDKRLSNELLERAAEAYDKVADLTPSHRTAIKHARTLGFLGRWEEAAAVYAELFDRERLVDRVTNEIDPSVSSEKPELLFAYLEWGVAESTVARDSSPFDTSKLLRAQRIFDALVKGSTEGKKLWWTAEYYALQTLSDLGQYDMADVALDGVHLKYPSFDEDQYGFQKRYEDLKREIDGKVFK